MLDAVSLGIALTAIAALIAVVFYLSSGGDDFEKAYDANARKLLSQDKDKQKQKSKAVKKKEKEKKQETNKPESEPEAESAHVVEEATPVVVTEPVVAQPAETKTKKNKQEKTSAPVSPAKAAKETCPAPSEVAEKENVVPESSEAAQEHSVSEGKKKKKSKGKKEEPKTVEALQDVKQTQAPTTSSPPATKPAKAKKVAVINVAELDSNKVLTRLASLEDVEPEYISYLATYFHDSNAKTNTLAQSVDSLKKSEVELKKKVEQNQTARAAAEKQLAEHQRLLADLSAKANRVTSLEETNKQQLSTINNIRTENDTLKIALTKSSMDAAEASRTRTHAEQLKQQLAQSTARVADLEAEVAKQQKLAAAASESSKYLEELESLKTEFVTLDAVARQMKAELEQKNKLVDEVKQQATAEGQVRAEKEKEELVKQFNQEKTEWQQKEANLMEEYTSLQALVAELHKEVAKFETYKQEQDSKTNELIAREKRIAESEKAAQGASEKLARENAELVAKVEDLSKKLDESAAAHAAEIEKLRAELSTSNKKDEGEEIVVLKAAPMLNAAPSSNEDVEKLREENNRLQEKNEELRRRNFKILDDVNALEKQMSKGGASTATPTTSSADKKAVVEERQLVAGAIGCIVGAKLNKDADTKEYSTWLNDVATSLKKRISEAQSKQAAATPKNKKSHDDSSKLQEEVEAYRNALATLSNELSRIETISANQSSQYEARIQQLEKKINESQISDLRASLNLKPASGAAGDFTVVPKNAPSKVSSVRSDESDWEVVSQ